MGNIPIALTIAGSDSGGGAGIQADLKSFSANKVYGASVITALTAQNTRTVSAIHEVPTDMVTAQMDAVLSDLNVKAVKIGMLSSGKIIRAIARTLSKWKVENIVLDPVMVTSNGDPLIADDAVEVLKSDLLPLARLVTPNLHEAARLCATAPARNSPEMTEQADKITRMGAQAVLLKGGHPPAEEEADKSADLLYHDGNSSWFVADRVQTQNTHGTGCSLSSAIAANLAKGLKLEEAVEQAKSWLTGAIRASDQLDIGTGHGPVNHFHNLW